MSDKWKMVVLDDDPTGIQTVHGCLLVTEWDEAHVREGFADDVPFFYILTNTRAMTRAEAEQTTRNAMEMVVRVNQDFGYRLIIVSRSDSCLRGHFPLETDVMREVLTQHHIAVCPSTPFCPAFIEAGRVTIDGVHYMKDGDKLIPVSETEFARDNVFAYHTSVLSDYIREKGARPEDYEIVNAASYDELYAFARRLPTDQNVIIRSSSSLPRAISGISDRPLLSREDFPQLRKGGVGVFIVGSHIGKTTRQLERLLEADGTAGVEVDVLRLLEQPEELMQQTLEKLSELAGRGLTPVVYTSRKEVRLDNADTASDMLPRIRLIISTPMPCSHVNTSLALCPTARMTRSVRSDSDLPFCSYSTETTAPFCAVMPVHFA